jgi:exodeoxyribonuclease V alpha subunit
MTAPLHPRGTLRARFEPTTTDVFRRLGVGARSCDLGDEGLYLAEELVAADVGWLGASEHPEALAITVLALMIAQRQGSTRLPLELKHPRSPLRALVADIARVAELPLDVPRVLRTIANLTAAPRFNSVIGMGEARLPLVVDRGCLYTERSRWLEERVATRLAARIHVAVGIEGTARGLASRAELAEATGVERVPQPAPAPSDRASVTPPACAGDVVASDGDVALTGEQARAVERAVSGRLTVITGGPGTGKTLVAAAIVRGFLRRGITNVALAAQTGKAANRLTEVIARHLAGATEPPVAQTLHRLLGYRGGRFTHHAQCPLPVGAVIVDEASMLDLELVDALLDALPEAAPLVLIGDAHQLPAIDAGQILADLTSAADAEIGGGAEAPRGSEESAPSSGRPREPIARCVAVLATSFRQDTTDPDGRAVYDAARAIDAGEIHRLTDTRKGARSLATPRTPHRLLFRGVEWVDTQAATRPHDATLAVAEALWHHFDGPRALRTGDRVFRFEGGVIDPAQRDELEQLWRLLGRARVLTVTRALATGSIAINGYLHELALDRLSVSGRPEFVPGEPVMVTANDYQRGLFNGDQGIIVRADEGLGRHHYRAVFRIAGELRPFAIEALRDRLELAWALTIHKSQGSELDAVALLLPHDDLPLVTRELLYTGVTRARTGVVIAGARGVLASGGKRRALRHSGLAERLRDRLGELAASGGSGTAR